MLFISLLAASGLLVAARKRRDTVYLEKEVVNAFCVTDPISCFNVHFQDENETDSALVGPTSDPASNLQPAKPTDFIAFINLVEFCRYSYVFM